MRRALPLLAATLVAAWSVPGCGERRGCLGGDDGTCMPQSACEGLRYVCEDRSLELRRIEGVADRPAGLDALAARGDVLMGNGRIAVVMDDLGSPHHLAPTGGSIVDFVSRDSSLPPADNLNQVYQVAGILPDDAAAYRTMELVDESPELVAVVLRGELDGRPGVTIVTRYEVRPCEPGVRIRTELFHGGRDPEAFFLSDGYYWGDREITPFVPLAGHGFAHPELSLLEIDEAFREVPFMAGQSHVDFATGSSIATVPCNRKVLHAFQDPNVSAGGIERSIVLPGDALAFERFIVVAAGAGLQGAVDLALEARGQLFGERTVVVSGRTVTPDGAPVGGDERIASLLLYEPGPAERLDDPDLRRPWAEVVPDARGRFRVRLPARRSIRIEPHVLGRPRGAVVAFETGDVDVDLGDVVVPATGRVRVAVTDPDGTPLLAEVVLVPVDADRREELGGSVYGHFESSRCSPYLGPPHGASPACNRALLGLQGTVDLAVPEGEYYLYATHGPFFTIDRAGPDGTDVVSVGTGETTSVTRVLEPLPDLVPEGVLSADLHVHAGASFDCSFPEIDRARSFVAADVDVIAATDHDVVTSYEEAIAALGIGDRIVVMPGVETTGQILFLRPPGSEFPKVIGHFNFWPLEWNPDAPRNGAPDDELVEPGELFDTIDRLFAGRGVRQLNHPFAEDLFGRDQGYWTAIGYDPRVPVPARPGDTPEGQLPRRPGGAGHHSNFDHDVQEVMNGVGMEQFLQYRAGWFGLLDQGIARGGTANSDAHTLATDVLGYPRNLVFGGHSIGGFDADRFDDDIRLGRVVGTNGPVLLVSVVDSHGRTRGPSLEPLDLAADAEIAVEVRAAPWIPVDEIRFVVNGDVARSIEDLDHPTDPFGTEGVLRFSGTVRLADLLAGTEPGSDAWIVVECGMQLPLAADLDDDGLPDTTDNDGDGVVDRADEEDGFVGPPRPEDDGDPRFHVDVIAPGAYPTAFTNPLLVDVDGDGWEAPPP